MLSVTSKKHIDLPLLLPATLPPAPALQVAAVPVTLVLYVPPHDLLHVLGDLVEGLGPGRGACVARELTKLHETFHRWAACCGKETPSPLCCSALPWSCFAEGRCVCSLCRMHAVGSQLTCWVGPSSFQVLADNGKVVTLSGHAFPGRQCAANSHTRLSMLALALHANSYMLLLAVCSQGHAAGVLGQL
jgi:hypothetical protein